MDKWEIKPLVSVGNIRFGMKREEIRNLFGDRYKEFKKNKYSTNTTDDYGNFHVFYTSDNLVDAVEIYESIEVVLEGAVVFPIRSEDIEKKISGIEREGNSYICIDKSIGIEVDADQAESILIGSAGYYG